MNGASVVITVNDDGVAVVQVSADDDVLDGTVVIQQPSFSSPVDPRTVIIEIDLEGGSQPNGEVELCFWTDVLDDEVLFFLFLSLRLSYEQQCFRVWAFLLTCLMFRQLMTWYLPLMMNLMSVGIKKMHLKKLRKDLGMEQSKYYFVEKQVLTHTLVHTNTHIHTNTNTLIH